MNSEKLGFSFPPQRRLKRRQDFLRVQTTGKRARSQHFLMLYLPQESSRIGITVTVKIDKRAVRRNLLKRRIRETFRRFHPRFRRQAEMVVIALQGAVELDQKQVQTELCQVWSRAGLLPQRPAAAKATRS